MADAQAGASDPGPVPDARVEHIGPKPHPARNVLIVLGLVAFGALLWMFYWRISGPDHPSFGELDHFREAMFNQCKDPQFSGPTQQDVARLYAENSGLRNTVIAQYHALQRGHARCEQVVAAIKGAGYPLH